MKTTTLFRILGFWLLFLLVPLLLAGNEPKPAFMVIVHKTNPVTNLKSKHLSRIFLKKQTRWPNDSSILPVDLRESDPAREDFSQRIHNKRTAAVKAYWQKRIFTGRGLPPPEKETDKDLLEYLSENPGAIGYVSIDTPLNGYAVKVITIDN